ncbi:MAG: FHA domain-containing protein [Methanomassiliicoccales archaeon]|nr:MAG: FHA domain-containing protein [Methanomassiliicoccales archaeon]
MDRRRKLVGLVWCLCIVSLFALALSSSIVSAQGWSVSHSFDKNPVAQGDTNAFRITLTNTYMRQERIDQVTCYIEWDLYSQPHRSGTVDRVVGSGESYTVSVQFEVPRDIAAKNYGWFCQITYDYQDLIGSWIPDSQDYGNYYDLEVSPDEVEAGIPLMLVIAIIIVLTVVIIAIVALYMLRKPSVQVFRPVHKVVEREEPVTRIRPRGAKMRSPPGVGAPETRAVEPGMLPTEVSAAGPGISVRLPNQQTRTLSGETVLGRADFAGMVSAEDARKISKRHLRIFESGGAFYVEDGYQNRSSTNGTMLDGRDIRGSGPQKLSPGSTISLAGIMTLGIEEIAGVEAPTMAVSQTRAIQGPRLVLKTEAGKELSVDGEQVFGRDQFSGIVKEDRLETISEKHFRIFSEGPRFFIEDGVGGASSTNGTFLNERDLRGKGRAPLTEGATIRVADAIKLKVHITERR